MKSTQMSFRFGSRDPLYNPKNGTQRVVTDTADGSNHLQVFMNGSWMHDYRCKEQTRIVGKNNHKKQEIRMQAAFASLLVQSTSATTDATTKTVGGGRLDTE